MEVGLIIKRQDLLLGIEQAEKITNVILVIYREKVGSPAIDAAIRLLPVHIYTKGPL